MLTMLRAAIMGFALVSSLAAADGSGDGAAVPAAPAAKIAFGVVTIAADRLSLTMADAKGVPLKLTITPATTVTIDLKAAKISDVSSTASVRVTYAGDTVTAIDQLKTEKKKKKKT